MLIPDYSTQIVVRTFPARNACPASKTENKKGKIENGNATALARFARTRFSLFDFPISSEVKP
jgi:hypothetical protein